MYAALGSGTPPEALDGLLIWSRRPAVSGVPGVLGLGRTTFSSMWPGRQPCGRGVWGDSAGRLRSGRLYRSLRFII